MKRYNLISTVYITEFGGWVVPEQIPERKHIAQLQRVASFQDKHAMKFPFYKFYISSTYEPHSASHCNNMPKIKLKIKEKKSPPGQNYAQGCICNPKTLDK
jgi:hypothetical protein